VVFSIDEMTGIQALERAAEDLPMSAGKPVAREFEYIRHGTQTLIAALNVASAQVQATCGDTRTEEDFADFIEHMIKTNPGYSVCSIQVFCLLSFIVLPKSFFLIKEKKLRL